MSMSIYVLFDIMLLIWAS